MVVKQEPRISLLIRLVICRRGLNFGPNFITAMCFFSKSAILCNEGKLAFYPHFDHTQSSIQKLFALLLLPFAYLR